MFSAFCLFCPWFSSSPCVRVLGLPPFRPCSPSDARLASKSTSFSQSGAPRGYFDLPRSLHGPRSARFDRGPRRSTLAAIATSSGVFFYHNSEYLEICPEQIQSWFFDGLLWIQFGSKGHVSPLQHTIHIPKLI